MPHHTPLIATMVAALVLSFLMAALAQRMRISPIAGYLLAGVLIGPFTPGFVADAKLAQELAEIGVMLLMFGVGLHFSPRDLGEVHKIAVPGAVLQMAVATLLGIGLGRWLGWSWLAAAVFGLALSVASTVVLLKALQSRDLVQAYRGRIAVGWLIVEDLAMVMALVLLPVIATVSENGAPLHPGMLIRAVVITLAKIYCFVGLMMIAGRRFIPRMMTWIVDTGSKELFRLAVVAIALGVAVGAAMLFGVSFALGAFFAGMILGETPLSRRATEETLPLQDAFTVLFFVSVGMLFNPAELLRQPLALLATLGIIVLGKALVAFAIVRRFGHPPETALTIAVSLAQIGEFSFILAGLGTHLGLLPAEGRDLILGGAILSILLNPLLFSLAGHWENDRSRKTLLQQPPTVGDDVPIDLNSHIVLVGYGRVGQVIASGLRELGCPFVIIEDHPSSLRLALAAETHVIEGNGVDPTRLTEARIQSASRLLIAVPEGFEGAAIANHARQMNPAIEIIARAHSDAEVAHLLALGASQVVMGEREIAYRMLDLATPSSPATQAPHSPVPLGPA